MFKYILAYLMANISLVCFSQSVYVDVFFDDPSYLYQDYIEIDTISNPGNIWQIGKANKTLFDSASTWGAKVMITDSVNEYPVNDTSYFYFKHRWCVDGVNSISSFILSGSVWVDADSLNDFGTIEFSRNDGVSWMDLTTDTSLNTYIEYLGPSLTGGTGTWSSFYIWCDDLISNLTVYPQDIIFRFGMSSDNSFDAKDGIMYSHLEFSAGLTEVSEQEEARYSIFPNPVSNRIYLNQSLFVNSESVKITDIKGEIVEYIKGGVGDSIDVSELLIGIYILSIELSNGTLVTQKFVKI